MTAGDPADPDVGADAASGVEPAHAPDAPAADPDGLTAVERGILALESRTFRYLGAKEKRIRDELGLTPTQYYVRLNALLEKPDALRAAPALVNRLRARRVSALGEPT